MYYYIPRRYVIRHCRQADRQAGIDSFVVFTAERVLLITADHQKGNNGHIFVLITYLSTVKTNWLQFLFCVKADALKQQISKFYPQI